MAVEQVSMNIERLEKILHEMQSAQFGELEACSCLVRKWAEQIAEQLAITDHLPAALDGGSVAVPAGMSSEPGGHDWGSD